MEDWWAEPVKDIYRESLDALGGDDTPLLYGPGHVCWADYNFDDENVRSCLAACDDPAAEYGVPKLAAPVMAVVRRSLERLLAVPEGVRDCDPYCD
jgi:hypothetical protein